VWQNGTMDFGDFTNNKLNGYGRRVHRFRWIYEGEWKDGLKHGKGVTIKFNDEIGKQVF
jgi:hypothetical protein